MGKRKDIDCPFTQWEIDGFHAMLYMVNTSHHCANPAPMLWAKGYQWFEERTNREED